LGTVAQQSVRQPRDWDSMWVGGVACMVVDDSSCEQVRERRNLPLFRSRKEKPVASDLGRRTTIYQFGVATRYGEGSRVTVGNQTVAKPTGHWPKDRPETRPTRRRRPGRPPYLLSSDSRSFFFMPLQPMSPVEPRPFVLSFPNWPAWHKPNKRIGANMLPP
jgi:hypothetical protein